MKKLFALTLLLSLTGYVAADVATLPQDGLSTGAEALSTETPAAVEVSKGLLDKLTSVCTEAAKRTKSTVSGASASVRSSVSSAKSAVSSSVSKTTAKVRSTTSSGASAVKDATRAVAIDFPKNHPYYVAAGASLLLTAAYIYNEKFNRFVRKTVRTVSCGALDNKVAAQR